MCKEIPVTKIYTDSLIYETYPKTLFPIIRKKTINIYGFGGAP